MVGLDLIQVHDQAVRQGGRPLAHHVGAVVEDQDSASGAWQ